MSETPKARFEVDAQEIVGSTSRLNQAGWTVYGEAILGARRGVITGVVLVRQEGSPPLSPETFSRAFGLTDEQGNVLEDYNVELQEATGTLRVGYEGPDPSKAKELIEDAIAIGNYLSVVSEIQERYGPGGIEWMLNAIEDREILSDPRLQESLAQSDRGELTELTEPEVEQP